MIHLEFRPDPAVIARDRNADFAAPILLEEDAFVMPVRLRVDQTELLDDEGRGRPLPLLPMAGWGLAVVRALEHWPTTTLDLAGGGAILFARWHRGPTLIYSMATDRASLVDYQALLAVWEAFAREVQAYLQREVPELLAHPYWGQWLRREDLSLPEGSTYDPR